MADENESVAQEEPHVIVFSQHGKFFVWNADDAFKIRSEYRIVGSLIGSLPRKPKQNHCFSLPFMLTLHEAKLLHDKGLATVVETPEHFALPSKEEVEKFVQLRCESVSAQIELCQRGRQQKRRELAEVIQAGRRRKRKRKRNAEEDLISAEKAAKTEGEQIGNFSRDADDVMKTSKGEPICDQIGSQFCSADKADEHITTPESCSALNNKEYMDGTVIDTKNIESISENLYGSNALECKGCPQDLSAKMDLQFFPEYALSEEQTYFTEQGTLIHIPTEMPRQRQAFAPVKWTDFIDDEEKLCYRVFSDLWEKGYYITSGAKFGGDFLAYPGDPLRYHSFFIVIITPQDRKLTPFELIAAGRLGATVKKTALLSSVGEDGEVVYTSVKWSGIS